MCVNIDPYDILALYPPKGSSAGDRLKVLIQVVPAYTGQYRAEGGRQGEGREAGREGEREGGERMEAEREARWEGVRNWGGRKGGRGERRRKR